MAFRLQTAGLGKTRVGTRVKSAAAACATRECCAPDKPLSEVTNVSWVASLGYSMGGLVLASFLDLGQA